MYVPKEWMTVAISAVVRTYWPCPGLHRVMNRREVFFSSTYSTWLLSAATKLCRHVAQCRTLKAQAVSCRYRQDCRYGREKTGPTGSTFIVACGAKIKDVVFFYTKRIRCPLDTNSYYKHTETVLQMDNAQKNKPRPPGGPDIK